jgi:hypothetical protein
MGEPDLRLGRAALAGRAVALLAGSTLVLLGTAIGNDDKWPFAPMAQFAFSVDPQSEIRSTHLDAVTVTGQTIAVPLSSAGVGLRRAEVEGKITAIVADPTLLQDLADRYHLLHPGATRLATLLLKSEVTRLKDGIPTTAADQTLAVWQVTG